MADRVRVACVQLTSRADKAADLEKAERLVCAAVGGADVVVLPQKWNGIGDAAFLDEVAEPLDAGQSVDAMAGWARRHGAALIGGSITERRHGRQKLCNTCCVSDRDGTLAAAPDEGTVIVAELDRARPADVRAKLPSLANRQPDAYRWPAPA